MTTRRVALTLVPFIISRNASGWFERGKVLSPMPTGDSAAAYLVLRFHYHGRAHGCRWGTGDLTQAECIPNELDDAENPHGTKID